MRPAPGPAAHPLRVSALRRVLLPRARLHVQDQQGGAAPHVPPLLLSGTESDQVRRFSVLNMKLLTQRDQASIFM